jgi:single-stranded-DNA-specific exonuclease
MLKTNIKLFKIFLNNLYKKHTSIEISNYISKLSPSRINKVFMDEINLLSPFGNGNPAPYFLIENVKIIKPLLLKKKFISCFIKSNNKLIKAISFNPINSKISLNLMNYKNEINIISRIKQNKWNNKNSIQLEVIDVIR